MDDKRKTAPVLHESTKGGEEGRNGVWCSTCGIKEEAARNTRRGEAAVKEGGVCDKTAINRLRVEEADL